MSHTFTTNLLCILAVACIIVLCMAPAHAFTANSLDITIDNSGDAVAVFRFTLEGFLENAIPQSLLEDELKKGLTTSADPPVLLSSDRTGVTMLLKKFADTREKEQGTEYRTPSMNFQKAEIALKNSALNNVVTADFSPEKITVTFPDAYTKQFENTAILPALSHIVLDPSKPAAAASSTGTSQSPGTATPGKTGMVNVSASPSVVKISIDGSYAGDSPKTLYGIPAGPHTFLFEKDGYQPVTKSVTVVADRTASIMVSLQSVAAQAKEPSGVSTVLIYCLVIAVLAIAGGIIGQRIIQKRKNSGK
jgi:hypothetical protein